MTASWIGMLSLLAAGAPNLPATRPDTRPDGPVIQIDCRLLTADEAFAEKQKLEKDNRGGLGVLLTDEQSRRIVKDADASPGVVSLAAPRLAVLSGQPAGIRVGQEQSYIAARVAVQGPAGAVDYQPKLASVWSGLSLDIVPTAKDQAVQIKLHPKWVKLRKLAEEPAPGVPADRKITIQKPDLEIRELTADVVLPVNQTMLFDIPPAAAGEDKSRLLLLVRVGWGQ